MKVVKRGNRGLEEVKFDKITSRLKYLCADLDPAVNVAAVSQSTIQNIHDGISTEELDNISAGIAESFKLRHPDYSTLAARICVSNLHKSTPGRFSECMGAIYNGLDILSPVYYRYIGENAAALDNMIINQNDYSFDYFGFKTMESNYLIKIAGKIVDRPQYMFMRIAVALYSASGPAALEDIKVCYKALSQLYFIHATPTLFNSCMRNQQLLSCFLLQTGDSVEGIMKTLTDSAIISKWAGGIGIAMHSIRAQGSYIRGTNGKSSGLPKQLKIYNEVARCFDQGGKRLGAFAIYIEPWHGDVVEVLRMKLNVGAETERARDLFYALWVPDLFVRRVLDDSIWSLFSEHSSPHLSDVYDGIPTCTICGRVDQINSLYNDSLPQIDCVHNFVPHNLFTEIYQRYESEGRAIRIMRARDLLDMIGEAQRESGTPYVLFKDHCNRRTNQQNIGTIKSSNLCAEIVEYSAPDSYACCTLASINLKNYLVHDDCWEFDHHLLHRMVRLVARNLNRVIDINTYSVPECRHNNLEYRTMGIGVQGIADVFCRLRIPFLSEAAAWLDIEIAETIYHAAVEESVELAIADGPYKAFRGSPAARGVLQFDLWLEDITRRGVADEFAQFMPSGKITSGRYDWDALKARVCEFGLRNSLLVAYMPTVSTSQILGSNESFEPFATSIHTKNTLFGKYVVSNHAMITHMIELGLWSEELKNEIINADGSILGIHTIPPDVRKIYMTNIELSQKELMRRAAARGAFIDQSTSLNIHFEHPDNAKLRAIFLWGHKLGLKTGSYYIRGRPASHALKNNATSGASYVMKDNAAEPAHVDVCQPGCDSCSA